MVVAIAALGAWTVHDPPEWWVFNRRGQWKHTIGEMQKLATALDAHARDHTGRFPVGDGDTERLREQLEPTYIRRVLDVDAWGHRLLYRSDGARYELRCLGRDGREEAAGAPTRVVDQDLIIRDGAFLENDIFVLMMSEDMSLP